MVNKFCKRLGAPQDSRLPNIDMKDFSNSGSKSTGAGAGAGTGTGAGSSAGTGAGAAAQHLLASATERKAFFAPDLNPLTCSSLNLALLRKKYIVLK